MKKDNNHDRSPGQWTAYILYVAMVTIMYFAITPKVVGPISEHEERDFHVAVVRLDRNADEPPFAGYTIRFLKSGEVDPASISFLLPEGNIDIPGGDAHTVTVLERHADWQLIEYRYGNSHDSTSLYRAFKDRIEPVSYHITMHPGVFLWAVILVFPAHLLGKRINAAWNAAARRKDSRPE
jgi:hypothetical protein